MILLLLKNVHLDIRKNIKISHFLGKNFVGNNDFQNMFAYQPTFNRLKLREGKGTENIIIWKQKGLAESSFKPWFGF